MSTAVSDLQRQGLGMEPKTECDWCKAPSTTTVYNRPACQACKDGGRQHRVKAALRRWLG